MAWVVGRKHAALFWEPWEASFVASNRQGQSFFQPPPSPLHPPVPIHSRPASPSSTHYPHPSRPSALTGHGQSQSCSSLVWTWNPSAKLYVPSSYAPAICNEKCVWGSMVPFRAVLRPAGVQRGMAEWDRWYGGTQGGEEVRKWDEPGWSSCTQDFMQGWLPRPPDHFHSSWLTFTSNRPHFGQFLPEGWWLGRCECFPASMGTFWEGYGSTPNLHVIDWGLGAQCKFLWGRNLCA